MNVLVDSGAKRHGVESVALPPNATVGDLLDAYKRLHGLDVTRQAYKFKNGSSFTRFSVVHKQKTLKSLGVANEMVVFVKDVGPQFSYRGVFFWEYFGPLAIMLFFYTRPAFIYGDDAQQAAFEFPAALGVACWAVHYAKRLFETFFVHRFSRPTMPLTNLFKNCGYYWSFTVLIAYFLCHPGYSTPTSLEVFAGFALFTVSEILNAAVHLYLRSIRPATDTSRRMPPTGPLFALVTSPNYTAEVFAWIGFAVMVRLLSVYVFVAAGTYQMTVWALGKYKGYLKTDRAYAKKRKAIIPFVI